YIFGDDTHSNISGNQATAESAPYIFTIAGSPTPGPTPTPGANLLNVWHIPSNNEPPSVTMRNPLEVHGSDSIIYVYAGGYPQTSIWSGTVYYRAQGVGPWQTTALTFDSNQGPNEYWLASFPNSFLLGTTVEYFLALEGDPETYATTYIYGDDGTSATTDLQTTAQVGAYTFTITAQPTPGPTVTPCNPVNAWHIPVNNEPPFPDITMRRPLLPLVSDENIYFYLGSYPVSTVWDEYTDLFYRKQGSSSWSLADFNFDTVHGVNEYWLATVANTFAVGDVVEYYLRVTANETYDVTYIYGDDTHSNRTCSEAEARQFPYTFPVGGAAAVPATGPAGLLLLLVAIGGLMGVATRKR
ncbi:VPLPA-CTERM sorting domain-containing protein, partial [bacterium]|nr:VPLPA-CTERM sorting domain-containing protein [candidate division CSSED10-310 bacterium]